MYEVYGVVIICHGLEILETTQACFSRRYVSGRCLIITLKALYYTTCLHLPFPPFHHECLPIVVVVVLFSHYLIATMQSVVVVTGQAPITLERKITSGGKHVKQKIIHTITETNRIPKTKR